MSLGMEDVRRTEKRCQGDSWQLQQRIGLRVPELADDGGVERVQWRVGSPAVKRRLHVWFEVTVRLL
jgi:hypothetical protein